MKCPEYNNDMIIIDCGVYCIRLQTIETGMIGPQFIVGGDIGFTGVVDEYDPAKPNDYEKLTKSRKQSRDQEDDVDRWWCDH